MILLALLAAAPLAAQPPTQNPLPKMRLDLQSLDGNAQDIDGRSDVTAPLDPQLERVWFAQGRKRAQIRVDTRERQFDEEGPESEFETRMEDIAVDFDPVNSQNDRLFTLTSRNTHQTETGTVIMPAKLTVDDISVPTAPANVQTLTFEDNEQPRSISTVPDENKLIVILPDELRVYDYSNGFVIDVVNPPGVAYMPQGQTSCGASLLVLNRAQAATIQPASGQETVALVIASVDDSQCDPGKPQPSALLIANITNPAVPWFYDDLPTQAWQPCRTPPTAPCLDFRVNDVAHMRTNDVPPRDLVYAVGGKQVQLWELDVTDVATSGIDVKGGPFTLNGSDNFSSVHVDPEAPTNSDYLYVVGQQTVHAVDRSNLGVGSFSAQEFVAFGNGPAGTPLFMLDPDGLGTDRREIWTLAMQNAPYVFRVTDFTQTGGSPLEVPDIAEGYYAAGPSDGAVANYDWEAAYLPTFGGVVRWNISGSVPIPNPNPPSPTDPDVGSYKPAQDPTTGKQYTTEHIALDDMGLAPSGLTSGWHALVTTAKGSFFAWPIDPTTKDPMVGHSYDPPSGGPAFGGYPSSWGDKTYGNDIIIATQPLSGTKWVVIDHSRNPGPGGPGLPNYPNGEFGIGRYNWSAGGWASTILWSDTSMTDPITPLVQALADEDKWLFVGAFGGFLVIDMQTGAVTDWVYVNRGDVCGLSFDRVRGMETYANGVSSNFWVFASLGDLSTGGFALAMYIFDPDTGKIIFPGSGLETDEPVQCLLDGPTGDDFPGVFVDEGGRLSLVELQQYPTELRIYSTTTNGHTLEVEFKNDVMTPLSYWNNGSYFEDIQDCNAYKVMVDGQESIRVVVAKTQETFEIVSPPDMP